MRKIELGEVGRCVGRSYRGDGFREDELKGLFKGWEKIKGRGGRVGGMEGIRVGVLLGLLYS